MTTIPLWFKIFLAFAGITTVSGVVNYFLKDKRVKYYLDLSDEKREKIIKSNLLTIKLYRFLFWLSPVYLFLTPFIYYKYFPSELLYYLVAIVLMYLFALKDFLYKKSIVKKICHK
jgi:hypothetical protein